MILTEETDKKAKITFTLFQYLEFISKFENPCF